MQKQLCAERNGTCLPDASVILRPIPPCLVVGCISNLLLDAVVLLSDAPVSNYLPETIVTIYPIMQSDAAISVYTTLQLLFAQSNRNCLPDAAGITSLMQQ